MNAPSVDPAPGAHLAPVPLCDTPQGLSQRHFAGVLRAPDATLTRLHAARRRRDFAAADRIRTDLADRGGLVAKRRQRLLELGTALDAAAGKLQPQLFCPGQQIARVQQMPLTFRVPSLLDPAVDAVAYAHAQGALHLSLNPSNLFLAGGAGSTSLKVLDFGVSKF